MDASPDPTPRLSIVVVPFGGDRLLGRCLEALDGQAARASAEILVVGDDRHDFSRLRSRFPETRFERLEGRHAQLRPLPAGL